MVWVRSGMFATALAGLFLGYGPADGGRMMILGGWLAATGFLIAIIWHEHLRSALEELTSHQRLLQHLIARLDRDWSRIEPPVLRPEYQQRMIADDLDVGGTASLLQFISLARTRPGQQTLQSWIMDVPTWDEVTERQKAVVALRPERALRMNIVKRIAASSDGTEDVYGLPQWVGEPCWLPRHPVAHALSWVGPAFVVAGSVMIAASFGTDYQMLARTGVVAFCIGAAINLLVTIFWSGWIHDIFTRVTGQHRAVYQFESIFQSFSRLPADNGLLDSIRQCTTEGPNCAVVGFKRLLWIVRLANLQRDALMYFLYLALQLGLLWDFRVLAFLEKWQVQFRESVGKWFDALGIFEAVLSGATLSDEYPQWAFPGPAQSDALPFAACELGHPLIADGVRVSNDITIEANQPLVLVTGSNMAGKSTFMRAVGLNLLLARTGAPICASRMEAHLFNLATSIRIRDSLKDGVSYFMAELKRLKQVVDLAHREGETRETRVLFLLDEVLQGTNSRERQIAVASVLEKLIAYGSIGFISTHDLDLAAQPEIQRVSQVVHFREYFETVDGIEKMRFDFKMRPGPTPTTNALKLLKLVGLSET